MRVIRPRRRSAPASCSEAIRRNLRNHVLPAWDGRNFRSIGRIDITKLCDSVEDNAGPVQANMILGTVTSIFKWYAKRNDNYNSPIIPGMRRTKASERARERILSDDDQTCLDQRHGHVR